MIKASISTEVLQRITTQQAWHYMVLPFEQSNNILSVYISDNKIQEEVSEELEMLLGCAINFEQMNSDVIRKEIAKHYRQPTDSRAQTRRISFDSADSRNLLINLIQEAMQLGSSDIHIEAGDQKCRVRMRIDGKLTERYIIDKTDYPSLINKIKIQAKLDIAEKRLPQDGRIFFQNIGNNKLDVRVSVLPTLHGEKVVMRLLNNSMSTIGLDNLGFQENDLRDYLEGIKKPNGIILISGPTGSGKTTTLYATLERLNKPSTNILTIEDPIEYTLEGINQVQLKESIGLDFPSAMRTFLRQDPDVIMVGEIRDKSTASMAIRASLTGHLVFSTIHTNSAWGIIARLIDMGIPSYLLADTLNTAVAQRLIRLLCSECKKEANFDNKLYPRSYKAKQEVQNHFTPKGCEHCFYTGYRGRKAIYEVISIDTELADYIKNEELNTEKVMASRNITSLSDNAFLLFQTGQTSLEEIYAILSSS